MIKSNSKTFDSVVESKFDENLNEYRICCGGPHVKAGALTVGILEILWAVVALILTSVCYSMLPAYHHSVSNRTFTGIFCAEIVLEIVGLAMGCLLIFAVKKKNTACLKCHLIWQALTSLCVVCGIVATIVSTATGKYFIAGISAEEEINGGITLSRGISIGLGSILTLTFFFMLILELWFLVIVYRYVGYLKDKTKWRHEYRVTYAFAR